MAFKIALAIKNTLFHKELRKLIDSSALNIKLSVVHDDFDGLYPLIKDSNPDLLILDFHSLKEQTFKLINKIKRKRGHIKIAVLSSNNDYEHSISFVSLGVDALLEPSSIMVSFDQLIKKLCADKKYFDDDVVGFMADYMVGKQKNKELQESAKLRFTPRELEVLQLICLGMTNQEIGEKLFLSPRTIEGYRQKMLEKSGLRNTAALVVFAMKKKIID